MDNEEGVQEQMKADLSALKDQMASISEVMLKLQKTIKDKATETASSTVREAESVLQPALNPGRDRNTAVFGRRYSLQAYPYGLPPDFTPRAASEDLSQAPTFEGQLPPLFQPSNCVFFAFWFWLGFVPFETIFIDPSPNMPSSHLLLEEPIRMVSILEPSKPVSFSFPFTFQSMDLFLFI